MPEIEPQLTYSPEGEFIVALRPNAYESEILHNDLLAHDGVELHVADTAYQMHVDTERRFGDTFESGDEDDMALFLSALGTVIYPTSTENLLPPDVPSTKANDILAGVIADYHHPSAIIYVRFQRWLNEQGIDEETAKNCLAALARPYGREAIADALSDFHYLTEGAVGSSFRVVANSQPFELKDYTETKGRVKVRNGTISWPTIDLETRGDSTTLSAHGRNLLVKTSRLPRLYSMSASNVDRPSWAFSLVLGLGSLAHAATAHQSEADILADAEWDVVQSHAKGTTRATLAERLYS